MGGDDGDGSGVDDGDSDDRVEGVVVVMAQLEMVTATEVVTVVVAAGMR